MSDSPLSSSGTDTTQPDEHLDLDSAWDLAIRADADELRSWCDQTLQGVDAPDLDGLTHDDLIVLRATGEACRLAGFTSYDTVCLAVHELSSSELGPKNESRRDLWMQAMRARCPRNRVEVACRTSGKCDCKSKRSHH